LKKIGGPQPRALLPPRLLHFMESRGRLCAMVPPAHRMQRRAAERPSHRFRAELGPTLIQQADRPQGSPEKSFFLSKYFACRNLSPGVKKPQDLLTNPATVVEMGAASVA
jgi:hypothetical protein